jgi:hypothetical protein
MAFVLPDPFVARGQHLLAGLQLSPKAVYRRIEELIEERQIPQVRLSRVWWPEAGLLSSPREYLRIERLGYCFDVCAAPFGREFFVSWRLVQPLPTWYGILGWHLASIFILIAAFGLIQVFTGIGADVVEKLSSTVLGRGDPKSALAALSTLALGGFASLLLPPLVLFLTYHVAIRLGAAGVHTIHAILIFGPLYMRFFNPVTYYALDTASVFQQVSEEAVKQAIAELSESKGLRALPDVERQGIVNREIAGA